MKLVVWCFPWTEISFCWWSSHSLYLFGDFIVRPYLVMIGSEFALMFGLGFLDDIDPFVGNSSFNSVDSLFLLFVDSWRTSCAPTCFLGAVF